MSITGMPTLVCSQCGNPAAPEELVTLWNQPVCASCKPAFVRRMQEGNVATTSIQFKGFWIRALARILDSMLMGLIFWPLAMIWLMPLVRAAAANQAAFTANLFAFEIRFYGISVLVWVAYYTFFHGKFGATLGKMAVRAKVVNADGSPITYGTAFGRCFADMLSAVILDIGYIMAGFDPQKRALHDRLCGTRVVAK